MEHAQEPWEALDVDDSDLPSLLLQPQRRPIVQRCSQTPIPQPKRSTSFSASPRLIPGPARAVQAAMLRRSHQNQAFLGAEEEPVPTQEYIRRVVENGDDNDACDDFSSGPWLCALEFLRREGTVATPLSSIKNGVNDQRVAKVVAIIKSCNPNGLGDMMVTLKDPTGTIGASIHRKVFTEGEFGKDISVGAVFILQEVAVFSPSRSSHYLNVTLSNLAKVIPKDSGPSLKEKYPASSFQHSTPVSGSSEKSWMVQRTSSLSQGKTEGIMSSLRQTSKLAGTASNEKEMEKGKTAISRNQNAVAEKESLVMRLGMGNSITEVASGKDTTCIDQEIVVAEEPTEGVNPPFNSQGSSNAASSVYVPDDHESGRPNEVNKRPPAISRTSLPQWTDEQLDLLMAFD